ncbi:MAG: YbjN domain-containing protein [Devosiaceae bacterium]|nr:YbjN domain-containing protein [Devosiaceae bacterium MH13]
MAAIILAAGLLSSTPAAMAQEITSHQPSGITKHLRDRGQTVIQTVDEFDDPFIETSVNNIDYNILFYGCSRHQQCTSLSLRAQRMSAGNHPPEVLNGWNTDQRWTKVYSADTNSIILEMDLFFGDLTLSRDLFESYLELWDRSLEQFESFVDEGEFNFVE